MARETFVDTSGFYALLVKRDSMHKRAAEAIAAGARKKAQFATTDYVLDETATLLKARGHGHLAAGLFDMVLGSSACRIEWMDPTRFQAVSGFFRTRADQPWSFTDCFSFVVMDELRLRDALTKDEHFRSAGFKPLLV